MAKDTDAGFNAFKDAFKFDKNQIATDIRFFIITKDHFIVVFKTTVYNKQDDEVRKKCIKLPDSEIYAFFPMNSEEDVKNVTITKDNKVKGKYEVTIPTIPGGGEEEGEEGEFPMFNFK